jgi:hypothetical protein
MKIIALTFIFISFHLYSQNNAKIEFEDVIVKIKENQINIDDMDLINEKLNPTDLNLIKILCNEKYNLIDKKIRFISGSAGTTISKKTTFLKSFKESLSKNRILQFSIIELNEKEKDLSNSDYLVFFWTKMIPARTKKLLKKIKNSTYSPQ